MTRTHHVTPARTAERLDKIRKLVSALQSGQMMRGDIADLLQLSPSGVRKYVADLLEARVMELAGYVGGTETALGQPEYRLTPNADRVRDYLAALDAAPTSRRKGRVSELVLAARNPGRHFHILADDVHYAVRVSRGIPAHEPVHAAFFGAGRMEARA